MSLSTTAVRRPIAVSVIVLGMGLFGLIALGRLPVDMMPEIEAPVISIITRYPGAGTQDVEENVTKILEESVGDIADLEKLTSTSKENVSVLTLTFAYGTNLDEAAGRIRENVEFAKQGFPRDVDNPMLFHFSTARFPTVMLGIASSGGDPFSNRKIIEDRILEPLRRIPGVGAVQVWNAPERQVLVEVSRERLMAYGLTIDRVARVLTAEGVALPAGNLDVGRTQFTVRTSAEYASLEEIGEVILGRGRSEGLVRVRDVATVRPALEELDEQAEIDGRPAMWGGVMKRSGANTVEVAQRVRDKLEQIAPTLPATLHVTVLSDGSRFILRTLDNLQSTALAGAVLVVLVIWLFLRRAAASLLVALAIPTSVLSVFLLLYLSGYTLNTMSLLAIAIAIGMVVDNAIVVVDNISRHADQGSPPDEAAGRGGSQVAAALVASTVTTLIIFLPLIFVRGLIGVLFTQLALALAGSLTASLLVALTLVPAYGARMLSAASGASGRADWFAPVERIYGRLLGRALQRRALVVAFAGVLAAGAVALLPLVGFDFMPQQDSSEIHFRAELPAGSSVQASLDIGRELAALVKREREVVSASYKAGTSKVAWATALGGREGSNIVAGMARLVPLGKRERRDVEIAESFRARFRQVPELVSFSVETGDMMSRLMGGFGRPLVVEILGDDYERMRVAAGRVRQSLLQTEGTEDVSLDLYETRPELRFLVDRERSARLGVSAYAVATALRTALYGQVITRYRPGGDDVDVMLRLHEVARSRTADITQVEVMGASGTPIKLGELGRVVEAQGPVEIRRKNKQRVVTVGASVKGRALDDVAEEVEARLLAAGLAADLTVQLAGEVSEQRKTFRELGLLLVLGTLLVYLVMAVQYESLVDPLAIMFSVPFCFTGAIAALMVTGTTLSVPAFLGVILLVGVVVNNAIVFVDYTNQLRRDGLDLESALVSSGSRRLRPILMTAITTVCGTLPLALGRGEGAEFWGPLGRAAVGGLALSTLVTLLLVPVVYSLFEPLRRRDWISQLQLPRWLAAVLNPPAMESVRTNERSARAAARSVPHPTFRLSLSPEIEDRMEIVSAYECGRSEALPRLHELGLPPPHTLPEYLDLLRSLLSRLPEPFRYDLAPRGGDGFVLSVTQCSQAADGASDGACVLLPRLFGNLSALGIGCQIRPSVGHCPLTRGGECAYTILLSFPKPESQLRSGRVGV